MVDANQLIATVGPTHTGTDGTDVFGRAVPFKKTGTHLPGNGVTVGKGGLRSALAGNVTVRDSIIRVNPVLDIPARADILRAPVEFDGDVTVKGSLFDGCRIKASGSIVINGTIEAADFSVAGWAHVKGAIVGRGKANGHVGGDLWCRSASGAVLSVRGDVHVMTDVAYCSVACTGALKADHGGIVGGSVTANGGIDCQTLGAPGNVPTLVEVGTDPTLLALLALVAEVKRDIESDRARSAKIRTQLKPLMDRMKSLSPAQREKVTELLYEADALDEAVDRRRSSLVVPCRATAIKSNASINVSQILHAGVLVRVPGAEALVAVALKGPLGIIPQVNEDVTRVVIERPDGTTMVLASATITTAYMQSIERLTLPKAA